MVADTARVLRTAAAAVPMAGAAVDTMVAVVASMAGEAVVDSMVAGVVMGAATVKNARMPILLT